MIIELRFEDRQPRAWMEAIAAQLRSRGSQVQVAWATSATARPAGLEGLFDLERMLLRKGARNGADPVSREAFDGYRFHGDPDLVIDFTGSPADRGAPLSLQPLYNGMPGENAALAAILAGDLPLIQLRNQNDAILEAAKPSAETADGLSGALDTVMARTATLLNAVLTRPSARIPEALATIHSAAARSPAAYVLRGLADNIARRIYRLCCYSPHWRIGWRHTDDMGIWSRSDLDGPAWRAIPSPAHRFYADPFAASWNGRTFVFFEDLDHHVGKGTISAIEFDESGPRGEVVPVLEEPWHLSYPFLIERHGELWMIPESSGHHDLAIYRCIEFPARWERQATLLDGLELADATIVDHDGLLYLFGASRDGGGGYSDTLSIFCAEQLFGPWRPHAGNPVLIDRASARPAGGFASINGRLWRPVQDCGAGYGSALGLAEVVELSPTAFRQVVRHTLRPGPQWTGRKLHTLNRCGRLEVIDGTSIQPRIPGPWQAHRSA